MQRRGIDGILGEEVLGDYLYVVWLCFHMQCVGVYMRVGQRMTYRSQFSFHPVVSGIELRSSGVASSAVTY